MNDERLFEILERFGAIVQGGVSEDIFSIVDRMIENDELQEDEFHNNEMTILGAIDNRWFTCTRCDWTMPISDMADNDDWECTDCADD